MTKEDFLIALLCNFTNVTALETIGGLREHNYISCWDSNLPLFITEFTVIKPFTVLTTLFKLHQRLTIRCIKIASSETVFSNKVEFEAAIQVKFLPYVCVYDGHVLTGLIKYGYAEHICKDLALALRDFTIGTTTFPKGTTFNLYSVYCALPQI